MSSLMISTGDALLGDVSIPNEELEETQGSSPYQLSSPGSDYYSYGSDEDRISLHSPSPGPSTLTRIFVRLGQHISPPRLKPALAHHPIRLLQSTDSELKDTELRILSDYAFLQCQYGWANSAFDMGNETDGKSVSAGGVWETAAMTLA